MAEQKDQEVLLQPEKTENEKTIDVFEFKFQTAEQYENRYFDLADQVRIANQNKEQQIDQNIISELVDIPIVGINKIVQIYDKKQTDQATDIIETVIKSHLFVEAELKQGKSFAQKLVKFAKAKQATLVKSEYKPRQKLKQFLEETGKEYNQMFKEIQKEVASKKQAQDAIRQKFKDYILSETNASKNKLDMTNSGVAAIEAARNLANFEIQWLQIIRKNLHHAYKAEQDAKSDLRRISDKIKEYKEEHNSDMGFEYVKDFVRCSYYFSDCETLYQAYMEFVNSENHHENCAAIEMNHKNIEDHEEYNRQLQKYTIIEVKPKLDTPLQNVTVIVAALNGQCQGEVQFKIHVNEPTKAKFLDHYLYELRRIYDNVDDENDTDDTFSKVMQKMYFYIINNHD